MVEFTNRYEALGMALPDSETMCKDQCEGTGFVPIKGDDMEEPWRTLWCAAEAANPSDDGWHFVTCPSCNGTGKR
jgi:hypothetical protein